MALNRDLNPAVNTLGIGTVAVTAKLHIAGSNGEAGKAPIKLTAGTVLVTPENGAIEFDGTNFYTTAGGVRTAVGSGGGGGGVSDGDKGDIVVSGSGTVWTLDPTAIAGKKTDSMATNKLLGRGTAGTGVIEEITLGTNLSLTGTTLNASGGAWTEIEVDFGTMPVTSMTFTVTDALSTATSKIQALPCGKVATGRVGNDWEWDGLMLAALPSVGSFSLSCLASGSIVGKRKIQYFIG